jgi:hypothetical protein
MLVCWCDVFLGKLMHTIDYSCVPVYQAVATVVCAAAAGCRRPYLQQMARAGFFEPLALPLMLEQSMAHIE